MNNKTNQQLELESYFEHGKAMLRHKESITKEMFPDEAQELAEAIIKTNESNTSE